MDPWFDAKWPKGSKDGSVDTLAEDEHLHALGDKVEEYGFAGASRELVAQNALATALKAQRMHIRYTQWSGAMARIIMQAIEAYTSASIPGAQQAQRLAVAR